MLDRDARFVKHFACNVARLGTGRDIGVNLLVWAGVAPASKGWSGFYPICTARAQQLRLRAVVPPAAIMRRRSRGCFQSPSGLLTTPPATAILRTRRRDPSSARYSGPITLG